MPTAKTPIPALSSLFTFLYKFIFSFLLLFIFVFLGLTIFLDNQEIKTKLGVLVLVAVAGIFFGWSLLRLKRVKIDKKYLYVSNYFSEIKVPLKYVDEVSENVWLNHRPIKVKFNISTKFGSSIVFMPKIRWFAFFSFNPMVDEIERAVRIAKRFKPHTK